MADGNGDAKKSKTVEEPNASEYLQLALDRVLELQREIKEGTYTTENTSDLGESSSEEDLTSEVLRKVFQNLPGTPNSMKRLLERSSTPRNAQLAAIEEKRVQLLGYDTCRRAAVEFMRSAVRETKKESSKTNPSANHLGFGLATYSRNESRLAQCKTGLLKSSQKKDIIRRYDQEIRERMLMSLDLHLAVKQRDYTVNLMRSSI